MRQKVLILENIHEDGVNMLKKNFEVIKKFETDRKKQLILIKNFDVIIIKSTVRVDKNFIDNAAKLKIIARAGTGLDNIDIKYCRKRKIKVINTPSLNSDAVADFTVMQILCLVRNAYKAQIMIKNRDFRRDLLLGRDMRKLKIGIIGFGNVGKKVAKRLIPFGSKMYILEKNKKVNKTYYKVKTLNELIRKVDVLSFHVPLNSSTVKMINKNNLKKIKKKMLFINTARAQIIDSKSLLKSKKKIIYATDVLDKEPPLDTKPKTRKYNNKLLNKDNIIVTPHMAASTLDTQKSISNLLSKKIIKYFLNY